MQWLWYGVVIGILWSCPPDAIDLEAARRGAERGFWSALAVEVGAMTVDSFLFYMLVIGIESWVHLAAGGILPLFNFLVLSILGCYYIFNTQVGSSPSVPRGRLVLWIDNSFLNGMLRAILTPPVALFIPSILGVIYSGSQAPVLPLAVGFVLGCLTWAVPFSLVVAGLRAAIGLRRYILTINRIVGVICLLLAIFSFWRFITVVI